MKKWHWHIRIYNIQEREQSVAFNSRPEGFDTLLRAAISALVYMRRYVRELKERKWSP